MALKPVSVSDLNRYIKNVLTGDPILSSIVVTGEISSWKPNIRSGAVFFTVKDKDSQIDCVMLQEAAARLTMKHDGGVLINMHGMVDYWNNRGQLRFNARFIEPAGAGELNAKYEELKRKLTAEGLFDIERKKPLPAFPKKVFVVTSGEGSAVEDIKKTIIEKNDYVDIIIYPVKVQGQGAAEEIAAAINHINAMDAADLMIVGRGGGSAEERWAFNEEIVVRSIADSHIPIITGIGHEDNESLSDLAADFYAKTPTAAADRAVPDTFELREDLDYTLDLIERLFERHMNTAAERVEFLSPARMTGMLKNMVTLRENKCSGVVSQMSGRIESILLKSQSGIDVEKARLDALSPKNIMNRGYGVIMDADDKMIKGIGEIKENDDINVTLNDGGIKARVTEVRRD
ncbi:MAG: exodeoxyribonuclease VII large subunit [Firmicutes bacterium]|nr:exodeoxyribonuclease VII large subunit [Bacillota bacterium]